jgi:hypothetical protein
LAKARNDPLTLPVLGALWPLVQLLKSAQNASYLSLKHAV